LLLAFARVRRGVFTKSEGLGAALSVTGNDILINFEGVDTVGPECSARFNLDQGADGNFQLRFIK
jgi:hypothetical protein